MGPGPGRERLNVWYARAPVDGAGAFTLTAVISDEHPNRATVDADPADRPWLTRGRYSAGGRLLHATVEPALAAGGLDLWYVEAAEPDAAPPADNLVAFAANGRPDGTVTDRSALDELGIDPAEQVGAMRWWTRTGQVHQIYVSPLHRRRRVATKLVLVMNALTVGRGWPAPFGTGELTELGEAWVDDALWSSRVQPWSRRLPPMTPQEQTSGVPRRNLVPDETAGERRARQNREGQARPDRADPTG